jgi:hypothetical protein
MVSENSIDATPSKVDADIAVDTTATTGDDGYSSYLRGFAV